MPATESGNRSRSAAYGEPFAEPSQHKSRRAAQPSRNSANETNKISVLELLRLFRAGSSPRHSKHHPNITEQFSGVALSAAGREKQHNVHLFLQDKKYLR